MFYMTIEGNLPQTAIPGPVSGTAAPQYTNYSAGSRAGDAALMAKNSRFEAPQRQSSAVLPCENRGGERGRITGRDGKV